MIRLNSPRVALVVISSVFILPLVLAWLMFSGVIDYRPQSTRNRGSLVLPPVAVSWDGVYEAGAANDPGHVFDEHWLVLHAVPEPCDPACLEAIAGLRQVHLAAGRNRHRIRLALLHSGEDPVSLQQIYASFHLLEDPAGGLRRTLESVGSRFRPAKAARGATYLIDPHGNVMMFYAAGFDPNDLKTDLQRLLTWSKLDETR
jgi:hypothetical protein